MTATFAAHAARLAGLATRAFGWAPGQFWHATPAELSTILTADGEPQATPLNRHELDLLLERETHD